MRNKIKTEQKAGVVCTAVVSALGKWTCEFKVSLYRELDASVETLSQPFPPVSPSPQKAGKYKTLNQRQY